MNVNFESCLTFTFVLLVICVGVNSGQETGCNTSNESTPRGICGERLARVHSNICTILRQKFPNTFQRKRSIDSRALDINSIPMSTLYSVDLTGEYPLHDYEKNSLTEKLQRAIADISFANSPIQLSDVKTLRDLFLLLKYNSNRTKRHVYTETNLVCECCYNVCTVGQLATYC